MKGEDLFKDRLEDALEQFEAMIKSTKRLVRWILTKKYSLPLSSAALPQFEVAMESTLNLVSYLL